MFDKSTLVNTAYDQNSSYEYDKRRFTDPAKLVFHEKEVDQLLQALEYVPEGASTLEVGCGTGRFTLILGQKGYRVKAVDPSPYMLEMAREKCQAVSNVSFALEEGAKLSAPDNAYDFVYSIRVTNQTESKEYALSMIQELIRVVKPGHHVLVEFVNVWRPRLKRTRTTRLTFGVIRQMLLETNTSAKIVRQTGIMVFSLTLFKQLPTGLLPFMSRLDAMICKLIPSLAARNYVLIRKQADR